MESLIPYTTIDLFRLTENIYECRLLGWVIAKAQAVLKLRREELTAINMQFALGVRRVTIPARILLPEGDRNYNNISKAFTLAGKTICYTKGDITYHLNIIAMPEVQKTPRGLTVSFIIHDQLWHMLLDFVKGWRYIHLPALMTLKSAAAITMYIMVSNQKKPLTWSYDKLRETLGATSDAYSRSNNFVSRYLRPIAEELENKTPYTYDYSLTRRGHGGRVTFITITPRPSRKYTQITAPETEHTAELLRIRLDERVVDYIEHTFMMQPRDIERLEALVAALGDTGTQLQRLADIATAARRKRVENLGGYLTEALRRG